MTAGIIFIVLGLIEAALSFFTNGVVNSRRGRWVVQLIGVTATKILFGSLGIAFVIAGVLALFGIITI